MAVQASIVATLTIGGSTYNVNLSIPAGTPTPADPYEFSVSQGQGTSAVDLMDLKIGDSTHYHLALTPPASLLSSTGVVETLSVLVDDNYNEQTQKFNP